MMTPWMICRPEELRPGDAILKTGERIYIDEVVHTRRGFEVRARRGSDPASLWYVRRAVEQWLRDAIGLDTVLDDGPAATAGPEANQHYILYDTAGESFHQDEWFPESELQRRNARLRGEASSCRWLAYSNCEAAA